MYLIPAANIAKNCTTLVKEPIIVYNKGFAKAN